MSEFGIGVDGLRDFRRVLRKMDRTLDADLTKRMKEAAEPVADEVRDVIPKRTGRAQRSVRTFARRAVAGVRVGATDRRTGYPYPRRLNYDPRSRSAFFMEKALEARAGEVERRMARLLDDLADEWGDKR